MEIHWLLGDIITFKGEDELLNKLKSHDRLMTENVDLRTQVKAVQLEVDKSSAEVEKVRSIDQCHTIQKNESTKRMKNLY